MKSDYAILVDLAIQATINVFLVASFFCLVYGIGLLMGSAWVSRLNDWGKRWVSTRQAMMKLEASRDIDSSVLNGHLWSGVLISLGSLYVLGTLIFQYDMGRLVSLTRSGAFAWAFELAVRSAWIFLVLGGVAGLLLGLSLAVRPGTLRRLQERLNRIYSARRATRFLEVMILGPDHWISAYPRACGTIIVLGSVYIAYSLGVVAITRA